MKKSIGTIRIKNLCDAHKVERFIEDVCDYYHIENEYFGNIILAVDETLNLLMKYKKTRQESIIMEVIKIHNGIKIEIKYTENSLLGNEFTDDIEKAILLKNFSRQTYIIKSLTDTFEINETATGAILVFLTHSFDYEKSLKRILYLKEYIEKKSALARKSDE